jgi:Ca2+-binding RTX toxin-like protein
MSSQGGLWGDRLEGFAGNDKITGRLDSDKLYGGAGADVFVYTRTLDSFGYEGDTEWMDAIFDFSSRQRDKIDLRKTDADEARGGNQAFHWIGNAAFHAQAGELRYENVRGGIYVEGDSDGDGIADLTVFLKKVSAMSKGDFYL